MLLAGVVLASPLAAQAGGRRPAPRPGSQPAPRPTPTTATASAAATDDDTSIELGVDGNFTRFDDSELNQVTLPSSIRAGFFLTPSISVEPAVAFSYSGRSGVSIRNVSADASLLWHLTGSRRSSQVYVRPFVGLLNQSVSGGINDGSSTDFSAGGAIGIKLPIVANRVAFRTDAFFRRLFTDPGQNAFGVNFGLSLYTR